MTQPLLRPGCPAAMPSAGRARFLVPGCAGLLALALAAGANEPLFRAINAWPALTGARPWALASALGEVTVLFALAAALVGRRTFLWAAVLGGLLALLGVQVVKELCGVPRPWQVLGAENVLVIGKKLGNQSFPSGHSAAAFVAAGVAWAAFSGRLARGFVLVAATLVALARVAVGAHWPVDVAAGAALGWLCAEAGLALAARWRWDARPLTAAILGPLLALVPLAAVVRLGFLAEHDPLLGLGRYALAGLALLLGARGWLVLTRPAFERLRQRAFGSSRPIAPRA